MRIVFLGSPPFALPSPAALLPPGPPGGAPGSQPRPRAPDVFVVAAFGQILRQRLLDVPRRGCLNVHASLLPRHRGAAPIAAAILAGDEATGVTVMEVVRALDAGPIVAQLREPISPFDTTGTLEERLARAGGRRTSRPG